MPKKLAKTVKAKIRYGGTPEVALGEAYRREAALALELITKAVIAQRIQIHGESAGHKSVPVSHDVPKLWRIAGLPALKIADDFTLLVAAEVLQWSGRYAAPRKDEQWDKQEKVWQELEALEDGGVRQRFKFRPARGLKWKDVNRLFKIANTEYRRLLRSFHPHP